MAQAVTTKTLAELELDWRVLMSELERIGTYGNSPQTSTLYVPKHLYWQAEELASLIRKAREEKAREEEAHKP